MEAIRKRTLKKNEKEAAVVKEEVSEDEAVPAKKTKKNKKGKTNPAPQSEDESAERKLSSSTFNVCVRGVNILERPGEVWTFSYAVAKKSEDNTAAKRCLRGISAEGRTKVAKEITAQEYNDAWIVLIHLEQSVMLQE